MSGGLSATWGMMQLTLWQMTRSRKFLAMVIVTCAPMLIVVYALSRPEMNEPYLFFNELTNILYIQLMLLLVTLINSTSLIRDEISAKTIGFLVTRSISRGEVALSRYLAHIAVNFFLVALPVALSYTYIGLVEGGLSSNLDILGPYLLMILAGVFAYGAFFYLLGILVRHPLMIGLLFAFLWELVLSNMPGRIPYITIMFYIRSLGAEMITSGSIARYDSISGILALGVLSALTLVLLMLSRRSFSGKDLI
ncbi:MAG: hypothetical protein JW825_07185 [Candidatus Methanofastidiosa archaeon]|nr:hypothetical protein [Candidatus Methanofastidiosa archaeon]